MPEAPQRAAAGRGSDAPPSWRVDVPNLTDSEDQQGRRDISTSKCYMPFAPK